MDFYERHELYSRLTRVLSSLPSFIFSYYSFRSYRAVWRWRSLLVPCVRCAAHENAFKWMVRSVSRLLLCMTWYMRICVGWIWSGGALVVALRSRADAVEMKLNDDRHLNFRYRFIHSSMLLLLFLNFKNLLFISYYALPLPQMKE